MLFAVDFSSSREKFAATLTLIYQDTVASPSKSKITPGVPSKFDWIKLLDGKEMEVEVRKISEKYVFYSQPGNMDTDWIDRRKVETIYFRTGRVEQMTKKGTDFKEVKDWRNVRYTKLESDVQGMIKVEEVSVKFEATERVHYKANVMENNATILMRRQAALLNADVVLITSVTQQRSYGEPPVILMQGVAYKAR